MKNEVVVCTNQGERFEVTTFSSCCVSGMSFPAHFYKGSPSKLIKYTVQRGFLPPPWFNVKLCVLYGLSKQPGPGCACLK